jgi:mono/diheme cytochrome c family protein
VSLLLLLALAPAAATPAGLHGDDPVQRVAAAFQESCTSCHGGERPKAGLDLGGNPSELLARDPELWRELITRVEDGDMPPPPRAGDAPAPSLAPDARAALLADLRAASGPPSPPRAATLRRLTRFEYERCVEDLFGVRVEVEDVFPADAAAYGFDTVGDVMFLTDVVVERYFDAAQRVLEEVAASRRARARFEGEPEAVLRALLLRAFRRPPTEEEVQTRLALVEPTGGFAGGLRLRSALLSVLVSPHFLFRVEADRPGAEPRPLDPFELATRLAFTLWAQGPDDELLEAAGTGALLEVQVLRSQAQRLLRDPRSRALADGFASQWLRFREMPTRAVDFRVYRGFGDDLKRDLYEESALFFDALVREGLPVTELVAADWTYLNRRLAAHYGLPEVQGGKLRRTAVPPDQRGGVLAQGSTLTLTSHPTRTSPVLRGAWILEALLDAAPPPPPPDVGALPAAQAEAPTSVRERLEAHRADPACAGCHARIDPLGFALEAYDGVGRLREEDGGRPLDTRGTLPGGETLEGLSGLKTHLAANPERLAKALLERLFVYGIGRPSEAWDAPALDRALRATEAEGWSTRALVLELVTSEPFRTRGLRD